MKIWFFDNSTALKSPDEIKTRARGGMVSSLIILSDDLARRGFECRVYSDVPETIVTKAGVAWMNCDETEHIPACDVLVCNRGVGQDGFLQFKARKRVLWTHDLPHAGFCPVPKTIAGFDRVVFMSRYAERVWRAFFPAIRKSTIIPNGVDRDLFKPAQKDMDYLIYGSAPNRGLNHLALIYESLRSRCRPGLRMRAYTNMDVMHPKEAALGRTDLFWDSRIPMHYKSCAEAGIEVLDPLPQDGWAGELGKASLMIVPSDYAEICSNNVLQALSCGTPVVTTGGIGSVGEWVKSGYNGYLSTWKRSDYMIHLVDLIRGAMRILNDRRFHVKLIRNAPKTRNLLTWDDVGQRWATMVRGL